MDEFARRLLQWFDRCGRHDLPWQTNRSPYRVWVSEIMLQQTQVATVVPYFERFVARFPDVGSLASAELDDVLALWAGLGYYARARNLHRAARIVAAESGGELPQTLDGLTALPGIGRSTAGAILAQAHGQRHPILDGNVKRVLARRLAVEGWPGERDVERQLWAAAERLTPAKRVADYTQAIMDLGATLCVRRRPACVLCPVADDCRARELGLESRIPAPRPKRERPRRRSAVLVVQDPRRRVLLERRPERGVWGGLYSLPELSDGDDAGGWCRRRLGVTAEVAEQPLAPISHAFTHFDLDIEPVLLRLDTDCDHVADADNLVWYDPSSRPSVGLAAPIGALLAALERQDLAD